MEKYEMLISFWTLVISSTLSLLTIIVNIMLTFSNMHNNKKIKAYDLHKEALIKYYLSIKYELIKLESILKEDNGIYFDMFCLYANDIQKQKKRSKILDFYKQFIEDFGSKTLYFTNEEIDRNLSKIYEHMLVITLGNEHMLGLNKYKTMYNMPDVDDVINCIDKYSLKYEAYNISRWRRKVHNIKQFLHF